MLSISLFGAPQIVRDGQPLPIPRRKSRALLYFLSASPQPVQREALIAMLWIDLERSAAQQVLRTTLHGLRKALGDALLVERDLIGLNDAVTVDARVFERALRPLPEDVDALRAALSRYRGVFLEGFSLTDAPEFDDWQTLERERYQRLALRALSALSQAYTRQGDFSRALAALERALALDPLQEDVQRESIRLAYLSGDRAGAIRRYDTLRRLLDDELGVPPMLETRSLYDDILADRVQPPALSPAAQPVSVQPPRGKAPVSPAVGAALPFLSRAAELRTLQEEFFSGRLLLVEGEPGIGKTRLVREALAALPVLALIGSGRELEQSLSYHPVIEALRGLAATPEWPGLRARLVAELPALWLQETARLLPELGAQSAGLASADEWRLWEGLSQFLRALARHKPVVLFLDDLHWADASTLRLLGYLLRQPAAGQGALGFVGATRPFSGSPALSNLVHTLTRAGLLEPLPLRRFTTGEVREIAAQISPRHSDALAAWLEATSEGNPYILSELLRAARQQGYLPAQPGAALDIARLQAAEILPNTVYSLVQSRLAHLSDPARRLLDAAVAIGRDFDFELTAHAAALSEEAALDGMDELLASGLVIPAGESRYRFDHSLTMEVAYREAGEARHRRLHRQVAEAMQALYSRARLDSLAGQMVFHFTEGGDARRAAPYALRAARSAAALAGWQEAAAFYRQALDGLDESQQFPVWMELGEAESRAGDSPRAVWAYRAALTHAETAHDPIAEDAARLALAAALLPLARFQESMAQARAVLANGRPASAFHAQLWLGTLLSIEGADLEAAARHLHQAETLVQARENPLDLSHVRFELGSVAAQLGDLSEAVQYYRAALEAALQAALPAALERRALAYNNLAYHLHLLDDPTAGDFARIGLSLAQEWGMLYLQTYLHSTLGEIALAEGRLEQAAASFTAGLELSNRLGIPERITGLTANLGRLAAARGETALAVQHLRAAIQQADELGLQHLAAQARIWLAALLPPTAARAALDEARKIAGSQRRGLIAHIQSLQQKR